MASSSRCCIPQTDETTASDIDTELEVHTSEPKQRLPDQVKPEDFLDKCTAIANEVADHLRALREEQKHSELEHTTIDKFGDLLAACPTGHLWIEMQTTANGKRPNSDHRAGFESIGSECSKFSGATAPPDPPLWIRHCL